MLRKRKFAAVRDRAGSSLFTPEQWAVIAERLDLSPREAEITRMLLAEETERAIGAALRISEHTVHTHLERLHRKLGVCTRTGVLVSVFSAYLKAFPHVATTVPGGAKDES